MSMMPPRAKIPLKDVPRLKPSRLFTVLRRLSQSIRPEHRKSFPSSLFQREASVFIDWEKRYQISPFEIPEPPL